MKWGYSGYTKSEIRKFKKEVRDTEQLINHMKDYFEDYIKPYKLKENLCKKCLLCKKKVEGK